MLIKGNNLNKSRVAKFILKKEESSKPEIANELGWSMPTVLQIVKELTLSGLITESGKYESTGGRKASVLSVVPEHRFSIGIDITANHISCVVIDLCGKIIHKTRVKSVFEDTQNYFDKAADIMNRIIDESGVDKAAILGVGVSLPGIVDKSAETLVRSHVLKQEHMSLRYLSQSIGYPTAYENDANSALLAEMRYIDSDMIYLSLSSSVGGAIYFNGSIYEGHNHRCAEFGHMIIEPNGRQCYCGKNGCVDAYCSAQVLLKYADTLEIFYERLEDGDSEISNVWNSYLEHLAITISNLRMIFDCDIMIGGYVGGYIKSYMAQLSQKTARYNKFEKDTMYIKNCTYEKEASAVGAAMYFVDKYFNEL